MNSLWAGLVQDISWGYRQWVVNAVAGSRLTPRLVRHAIYRAMGLQVRALSVSAGVTITGGANLCIGPRTFVNHGVYFEAAGGITVGRDCAFGPESMVLTNTHEITGTGWNREPAQLPVTIGDGCWVGARAVVLPGARIVDNCIIAAGAVVTQDCPEPGIWGGIPARLLRSFLPAVDLTP